MDAMSVWKVLADIKIGSLFAWTIVLIAIITTTIRGIKSIYSFITKYNEMKEINERQAKMLQEHEKTFNDINENLKKINISLDQQKDINLKYTRHIIVDACYAALLRKNIQIEQLASLEEMYNEYVTVFNGNSYVSNLVKRVRDLPIVGVLEEHDEDNILNI